jgi:hypothetical protein
MRYWSPVARWLYRHVRGEFGWNGGNDADRTSTVLYNQPLPDVDPGTLLPSGRLFADRGVYFYRSAWKSGATGDELLFSFFAGRFFGGHAQEDQGQITLYAHGDRYALDNGSAYPSITPKQTEAHNLVLIDGRGQHNAGQSIGTDAQIEDAFLSPGFDYVRADLKSAYDTHSPFNDPGVPFPTTNWSWGYDGGNPVERALRSVAVVKGAGAPTWFLVVDDIQKDASQHVYEWLLHTDAANGIDVAADPVTIQGQQSRLLLWFAHPRRPALSLSSAPFANGGEDPGTTRIVARVQSVEPRYVVALLPLPDSVAAPTTTISQQGRATMLRLAWEGATDVAAFNPTDSLLSGELETDGRMAVLRLAGTEVRGWMLVEGSRLRHAALDLLTLGPGLGSAAFSGTTLQLSRDDAWFVAYAPQVARRALDPEPYRHRSRRSRRRSAATAWARAHDPDRMLPGSGSAVPGRDPRRPRPPRPHPGSPGPRRCGPHARLGRDERPRVSRRLRGLFRPRARLRARGKAQGRAPPLIDAAGSEISRIVLPGPRRCRTFAG